MALNQTLLAALSYPRTAQLTFNDVASVRDLVVWLENMKIRKYQLQERQLLNDTASSSWDTAFQQYLQDLECPLTSTAASQLPHVIQWLLAFAVNLEYTDNAAELNEQATAAMAAHHSKQAASKLAGVSQHEPFVDLGTPEAQQTLQELLSQLHLDSSSGSLVQQLEAARELVGDEVLPTVAGQVSQDVGSNGVFDTLKRLPLGFDTGDAKLDAAATLLRMLYIKDLRALQSQIDAAVVAVQEYTANPRADAALGKVGR